MLFCQILPFTTCGKTKKKLYKNNKFKLPAPTRNEKFELPDELYSLSDIQDHFEYIIKKHETVTKNPPRRIYVKKFSNKITFRIKIGYDLELLTPETIKLFGSTKCKITKNENGENVHHLEITEVVLVHCNIVNNNYQ